MDASTTSSAPAAGSSSGSPLTHDDHLLDLQHSTSLASEYLKLIKSSVSPSNTAYLVETVAPLLVSGLTELLKAVEKEAELAARQRQLSHSDPTVQPGPPFNPVTWLASYLMHNNPRHGRETQSAPHRYRASAAGQQSLTHTASH